MKGSRSMAISDEHLETLEKYSLLFNLLGSNGIVDDVALEKLQMNVRALLEGPEGVWLWPSSALPPAAGLLPHCRERKTGQHIGS
ncbi:MAG: hypothetical protein IIW93_07440 [Bacteroidaceae bacterium]|nr:hypothetical protein [Bacteroidaceae bacterium]